LEPRSARRVRNWTSRGGCGRRRVFSDYGRENWHGGLIDKLGDALCVGCDAFGGEASGIVGELTGERDRAALDGDVHGGGLEEGLRKHFGLDVEGDGFVSVVVAGNAEEQAEGKKSEQGP